MAQDIKVFLDLSDEVQAFLEQYHINLYEELQEAEPSLRLRVEPNPDAPPNTRGDLTTVILAFTTLGMVSNYFSVLNMSICSLLISAW